MLDQLSIINVVDDVTISVSTDRKRAPLRVRYSGVFRKIPGWCPWPLAKLKLSPAGHFADSIFEMCGCDFYTHKAIDKPRPHL